MTFSVSWAGARAYWPDMLGPQRGKAGLRYLEVGCFEGEASLWLLENVLTHPASRLDVVDTFLGSPEHAEDGIDVAGLRRRFEWNVEAHRERVRVWPGTSRQVLRAFRPEPTFDFVYLDGSHRAADVLEDAVLAWPLLRDRGLLVFDDYLWDRFPQDSPEHPRPGIDAFLSVRRAEVGRVHDGYQLALRKLRVV